MFDNNTIVNELKEVSPLIAAISRKQVFSVPEGYFSALPDKILDTTCGVRLPAPVNVYSVANNYFPEFPAKTMKRINDYGLASIKLPYSLPAGYFETFAEKVLSKLQVEKNNHGSDEIDEELMSIAPSLISLRNKNVYSVPKNYFDTNKNKIESQRPAGNIVSLGSRIRKFVTYAAAASVFAIISATSLTYIKSHKTYSGTSPELHEKLADISDNDIQNYLDEGTLHVMQSSDNQPSELQNLFKNASDEEIQNYLNENAEPNEDDNTGI